MTEGGIEAFAKDRGLEAGGGASVRALTPMLLTGGKGSSKVTLRGALAPNVRGDLVHHVYADGAGRRESTVVLTRIPESSAYVPALLCRDRGAGGPAVEQLPVERWREVELESALFNRRYRLLTLAGQDAGWVRELLSPALISWLASEAPEGLSFEINQGNLAIAMPGRLVAQAELERLAAAAHELVGRIRAEASEEGELDPDLFDEREEVAAIERALGEVTWNRPPDSVAEAVDAYRREASRKPRVLLTALLWGALAGGLLGAAASLAAGPVGAVLVGTVVGLATFALARLIAASRYRWDGAAVSRVGLEAFVREYARSRRLALRDRWRFHSDYRDLALPGFADHVLAGEIPGADVEGMFVMFADSAEMRSTGVEMAFTSDRPLASNALVVDLQRPIDPDAAKAVVLPEEYRLETGGTRLVLWRPIMGNLQRTAEGSDRFRARAGEIVRQIAYGRELAP